MMTMHLTCEEEMIQVICVYAVQSGKPDIQDNFIMNWEWDMKGTTELTLGIGDFNGHVGKKMDGLEGVQENGIIG